MTLDEARDAMNEAEGVYVGVAKDVGEEHPSARAAWAALEEAMEAYAEALADVTIGRL